MRVNPELSPIEKKQLRDLLLRYELLMAFDKKNLGICVGIEHTVDTGDSPPIRQYPRILSATLRADINKQVEEWLEMGVIRPCRSEWSSPVVLVPMKGVDENGKPLQRLCIDFRKVNAVTKMDAYPLPNVRDCLDAFAGCRYFTSIDMNSGYLQIKVAEQDQIKTSFVTQDGLFCFNYMPFGLMCAPMTFARAMDYHLSGLKFNICIIYLDDCVIYSDTFEKHLQNIEKVFERIKDSGMTLSPDKCSFCQQSIRFLGHIVSDEGLSTDPDKIQAIRCFPTPSCIRDVRAFLGLAGYFRVFVQDFSQKAEPLSKLNRKNIGFKWEKEQMLAFNLIKELLTSAPILVHFDNKLPIELRCDGSTIGIGSILIHRIDGKPHVIRYDSRLLTNAEKNYCVSEIECLAIVQATEKCQQYLLGIKFTIFTDHVSLQWLATKKDLSPRLIRWDLHLQKYNYKVVYKSGQNMKDVDALSRAPVGPPLDDMSDNIEKHCLQVIPEDQNEGQKMTKERLIKFQKDDPIFGPIYKKVLKPRLPEDQYLLDKYTIADGRLLRRIKTKEGIGLGLCVPIKLVLYVLYAYHDDPYSGSHFGTQKTMDKICSRLYWPKMRIHIKEYVRTCQDCSSKKSPPLAPAGLMVPISSSEPWETVALDFLGPFVKSTQGNKHILVAVDHFTKWVEVRAAPAQNKETVAQFLIDQIMTKHGSPKRILTDQGRQFRAELTEYIFQRLGTKHIMTTSYHPQCNGLVEKFNQTLEKSLSMYTKKSQENWCAFVQPIVYSYNGSINATTGYSPYYLVHGTSAVFPADRALHLPRLTFPNDQSYVYNLENSLKIARNIAKERATKASLRNKSNFDKKRRDVKFKVGDLVRVFSPLRFKKMTDKLLHKWNGPFDVIKVLPNGVNYTVKGSKRGKPAVIETVHVEKMKPYFSRKDLIDKLERMSIEGESFNQVEDSESEEDSSDSSSD